MDGTAGATIVAQVWSVVYFLAPHFMLLTAVTPAVSVCIGKDKVV